MFTVLKVLKTSNTLPLIFFQPKQYRYVSIRKVQFVSARGILKITQRISLHIVGLYPRILYFAMFLTYSFLEDLFESSSHHI